MAVKIFRMILLTKNLKLDKKFKTQPYTII